MVRLCFVLKNSTEGNPQAYIVQSLFYKPQSEIMRLASVPMGVLNPYGNVVTVLTKIYRAVMASPSLEMFKARLDVTWSNLA